MPSIAVVFVRRAPAAAAIALAVAFGVAGCSGSAEPAATKARESGTTRTAQPVSPAPVTTSPTPSRPALTSALPTLPPGDPGAGPSVAEDTSGAEEAHGTALTRVPLGALLDAETVTAVVGGSWQVAAAPTASCAAPRPTGVVATRSAGLTGSRGRLVETVATHRDAGVAADAVSELSARLQACGWTLGAEPPLGEDSALLTRQRAGAWDRLVVVAAEGVSVTMLGRGSVADSADDWAAIVDVAIGTSCLAASDGCH